MRNARRIITLLTVVCLLFTTILTGCGGTKKAGDATTSTSADSSVQSETATKDSNKADFSEPVNLTMYMVGDEQPDAKMVYDKVNEKLKADINTTVQNKYLPWADWAQKYSLIFASGEDFDCIYTANWAYYGDQATKNAFMEINMDMIKTYMPDYNALVPESDWPQVKVNGKIYMIPYINKQLVGHRLALIRGDLREKYGMGPLATVDDLEKYMTTIAKNEKSLLAYNGPVTGAGLNELFTNIIYKQPKNAMYVDGGNYLFTVQLDDTIGNMSYALDDPEYLAGLARMKRLADAGAWSKNTLASKDDAKVLFSQGKGATVFDHIESLKTIVMQTNTDHPDWKAEVYDLSPDKLHEASPATRSGMAINAKSKYPERVMAMMNLFGTKKDYYDLTTYGIEGVHYKAIGDNKLESLEQGIKKFKPKENCPWAWERKDFMRDIEGVPEDLTSLEKGWINKGLSSTTPFTAFTFNDSNVKNEKAAVNDLKLKIGDALMAGVFKDVEVQLKDYKEKLKKAGNDKIQAEMQKQLTEYANSLK